MVTKTTLTILISIFIFPNLYAQLVPGHPDNSVSSKEFVEMGIPNLEKPWSVEEYKEAFVVLRKIKELDKYSLPRYDSKHSKDVFARMTNRENLALLNDNNYDIRSRLDKLNTYANVPSQMIYFYAEENKPTERFGAELLRCMLFGAQLSNNAVLLLRELKKELGEEGNEVAIKEGMNEMQQAHQTSIFSLINVFENNYERFDIYELETCAKELIDFLPKIIPQLAEDDQKAIKMKIEDIAKKHSYKSIRSAFKKLCKKLK